MAKPVLKKCVQCRKKKLIRRDVDRCKQCAANPQRRSNVRTYSLKAMRAELADLKKRQTLYEVIGDAFIRAVRQLEPYKPPPVPRYEPTKKLSEEDWVQLISDVQAGQTVDVRETGGLGRFDTRILLQELEMLSRTIPRIIAYHANRPRRVWFFLLGDMIEGSTIFAGQLRSIGMNTVRQVLWVVENISRLIAGAAAAFQEVVVVGVPGNHGRIGFKGVNSPMDNLDYLTYQFIQERLQSIPNVTCRFSESWHQLVEIQRHRFLLVHGEDVPAWMNIPFYGALRSESRQQKLFFPRGFHYLVLAHHHQRAIFSNVIMNGCWPGGSEFSLKRLQLGGPPEQLLFAVHRKWGITWYRPLKLRPPQPAPRPFRLDVRHMAAGRQRRHRAFAPGVYLPIPLSQ